MYKTELHCHSSNVSPCSRVNCAEIINKYAAFGYRTIVLTNHYSLDVMNQHLICDRKEFVKFYVDGYRELVEEAKEHDIKVLMGLEIRFPQNSNDYLCYGPDEEFLYRHPEILDYDYRQYALLSREYGFLFIQAHPFRAGMTMCEARCLDGVEVFNGHPGHNSNNDLALLFSDKYNIIKTSGTDFHYHEAPLNGGIATLDRINDMDQLIEVLRSGEYHLLRDS